MKSAWFVLFLLVATGAAAREKDADPEVAGSLAVQIARAAHLDLQDVAAVNVSAATQGKGKGSPGAMIGIAAGQAADVLPSPKGTSAGASFAIGAAQSLPQANNEAGARILGWVEAESPEAARAKAQEIVKTALEKSLPNATIYFVPKVKRVQEHLAIQMPGCENCRMNWLGLHESVKPKLEQTPTFISTSGGQRYAWGHPTKQGNGLLLGYPWSNLSMTQAERLAFLLEFSSHLPAEMAIYLPRSEAVTQDPLILYQGKALPIEQPAVATVATASTN